MDPNREAMLEILRFLNQAEFEFSREDEKGLELPEIAFRMQGHWTVREGRVKVPPLVALLERNQMVRRFPPVVYSWTRQRNVSNRYRVTAQGKAFLMTALDKDDRVP